MNQVSWDVMCKLLKTTASELCQFTFTG